MLTSGQLFGFGCYWLAGFQLLQDLCSCGVTSMSRNSEEIFTDPRSAKAGCRSCSLDSGHCLTLFEEGVHFTCLVSAIYITAKPRQIKLYIACKY